MIDETPDDAVCSTIQSWIIVIGISYRSGGADANKYSTVLRVTLTARINARFRAKRAAHGYPAVSGGDKPGYPCLPLERCSGERDCSAPAKSARPSPRKEIVNGKADKYEGQSRPVAFSEVFPQDCGCAINAQGSL